MEVVLKKIIDGCTYNIDTATMITGGDNEPYSQAWWGLYQTRHGAFFKVRVDHEKPEVDSVVSVWPTANWLERETYDMYGIKFTGHPDLRRMLLDDDFEGYPLLKSFHQVPMTVKPRATTQVDPNMAVAGQYQQKGVEHVVQKKVGQGKGERLHPGTPTFGHAFEGHQEEANQENATRQGESVPGTSEPGK